MIRVLPVVNPPVTTAVDGFGRRTNGIDIETGDEVELLDLSPAFVEHSGFVTALAERVARFSAVRHASYVHVRRLDRPSADRLELVSDHTPGWRVSELLEASAAAGIRLDITIVIALLRQLLPAVALYGRHNRDAAIGSLAVERLIVTPQARLVIAEHAFGPALEKLNLGRDKLWRDLRVAMPPSAGLPRSNQRADAHAIGVVAVALLLGRPLALEEFPAKLPSLVDSLTESRDGERTPLAAAFANWLMRTLQFEVKTAFHAPAEAQLAFESVLASDRAYMTSSRKLEEWVATVGGGLDEERRPKPDPEVLRQQELAREQALERQREEERLRDLERQQEEQREQERERELVRLRELERERGEELERLREQERQRALEVERLREQQREHAEAREREAREREQEHEQEREQQRDRDRDGQRQPIDAPTIVSLTPESAGESRSDAATPEADAAASAPSRSPLMYGLAGIVLLLLVVVGWLLTRDTGGGMREGEGELAVQSRPPGARVIVDSKDVGVTPTTVRLPAGAHVLEVQVGNAEPRVIPLTITAGVQTAQYIELQGVAATGALEIRSEPSGARVTINGQPRGTTPATIRDLPVGDHTVVLELRGRKATQAIRIAPGSTAQLVVPLPRR